MYGRKIKSRLIQIEEFLNMPRSRKAVKHFALGVFGVIVLITTYVLSFSHIGQVYSYNLGDISADDIRVVRDIRFLVDAETKVKKEAARNSIPPIFNRDYQVLRRVIGTITAELSSMLRMKIGLDLYDRVIQEHTWVKSMSSVEREDIEELLMNSTNRDVIKRWAQGYATLVFDNYGILPDELKNIVEPGVTVLTDSDGSGTVSEDTWNSDQLIAVNDMYKHKNYSALTKLGSASFRNQVTTRARKLIQRRILYLYSKSPYLHYNSGETEQRKIEAENLVKPVYGTLKKGLTIVRAGDPINQSTLDKIAILNQYQGNTNVKNILGIFLIQLLLALGISYFIHKFSEFEMRDLQSYIILGIQILTIVLIAFPLARYFGARESEIYFALFVPVGLVTTIGTLLLGAQVTFAMGVFLSVFLFMISGNEASTFIISIFFVITGIYSSNKMERRTQFINSILLSGTVISVAIVGLDLSLNQISTQTYLKVALAFLNAMLGIILATGFLPFYENVFNLPTRFRLMELTDFNNPLLRRMSEEAPSSYTHSIVMASLSERAVSVIGGDSLLARVGCLYHDIGKMINAEIYAENKHLQIAANKASGLTPKQYAVTIIKHVLDGIDMARAHRLPEKVIAFIPEHHGTSLMRYFYHEALKVKKEAPDKYKFRYPGPKPQTKETAVVMMADSLEAASRSVPDPTKENLEKLVDTIIKGKIDEGQLDECPLTLYDLKKIKESFLHALLSTFHLRPQYPTSSETEKLENQLENNNRSKGRKKKTKGKK
ncbi:MAG: HDIG domain-containing metalloprotein [Leptospirales bacterium]